MWVANTDNGWNICYELQMQVSKVV